MSGVEIAGLVLGIIPLVLAAADHQRKVYGAVTTTLRSRVKDEKLASQYQNLHNEVALLNLTIRDFIFDLPALSTGDKQDLLKLDEKLWKDDRVELALSQKLGTSNTAFVDTLKTVLQCLDDVLSDRVLKLEKADIVQAPRGLYAKLQFLRTYGGDPKDLRGRIRFTSSNTKRNRALATLTEQNKTLERFIRHTAVAEEQQGPQTAQESEWKLPPRSRARNLIHSMYDAIARVWTSHCNCPSPHEAMLSLCGCFAWFADASDVELDLFISSGSEAQRKWQESRVRVNEPPASTSEGKIHVDSICAIVSTARQSNVALEVVYESNTLWHKARKRSTTIMEPCITLDQLLRHETSKKLKERRALAVLLAHSLLHLSDSSSWLKDEWDKTHISFFPSAPDHLNLKPYLTTDFQALAESNGGSGMQLHPSPAILALGIVLLELQIWGPIESRRTAEDLTDDGLVNVNTNLMTAERVFQDADDEIFENYRKAVRACLNCDFLDEHSVNFSDDEFRKLVYENIVAPLERELYQGWKMKPKDLLSVFV
ncbi:hypothetical protein BK809_0004476 [Diplodia seriata]|uniref:DUF7580 domain-containing protein n=1 Tax=Diplodia seriata TaxID=420778 RepID=A0A1S8B6H3_9PEZI|nr:hypothetical protein BK809_0004476 [Diplodia seriata]